MKPEFEEDNEHKTSGTFAKSDPSKRTLSKISGLARVPGWLLGLAGTVLLILLAALGMRLIPSLEAAPTQSSPNLAAPPSLNASPGADKAPTKDRSNLAQTIPVLYTVQAGDTPALVAQKTGVGLKDLLALNHLDLNTPLEAGRKLVVGFSNAPPKPTLPAPRRLTPAEAEPLVRAWYQKDRPDFNPQATLPLRDLTTDEIWERLKVQVFQVSADAFQYDTFLIRDGDARQMGTAFGGAGVTSLAVADLNGDGQPELLFTYSFGSGIPQSRLGIYLPDLDQLLDADRTLQWGDLRLEKVDDRQVKVIAETSGQVLAIGQAALEQNGVQVNLTVQLAPGLPQDLLDHLSTLPKPTPTG